MLAATHEQPQFYDVPASVFEQQLVSLKRHGFRCVSANELLSGKEPGPESFILSFDDATTDHLEVVAPILGRHDCRATFFVPTGKLNGPGYISDEGVKALAAQGHVIGLHSHEHRRMDRMTSNELSEQMRLSKERLQNITGTTPRLFAPPGGFMSGAVREAAVGAGVGLIRTMRWGYNRKLQLLDVQCVPINARTTAKQFENFMHYRNLGLTYNLKQVVKAVLPGSLYQRFRDKIYAQ